MRISDWSSDVCSSDLLIKDVLDANRETQPPEEAAVSFGSKVQNRVDGYERWHRGNRLKAIVPHGADIASYRGDADIILFPASAQSRAPMGWPEDQARLRHQGQIRGNPTGAIEIDRQSTRLNSRH